MLRYRIDGDRLSIEGDLDEGVTASEVEALLGAGRQSVRDSELKLDLSGVVHANSLGIRAWLTGFRKSRGPYCYVRMPVWLVAQCNMISEFMAGEVRVDSLFAPFYCVQSGETIERLLVVGKDVPLLEDYSSFDFPFVSADNKVYEPDFDAAEHFGFLRHLTKRSSA